MTELTDDERARLEFAYGSPHVSVESAVGAIVAARTDVLTARLAAVEALADEWAAEGGEMSHWFAAQVLYDLIDHTRATAHTEQTGAGA